jgi:hypothetical protein
MTSRLPSNPQGGLHRRRTAFPKFESYGMPDTAAFRGWKAQDAIEWFHGIGRLVQATEHERKLRSEDPILAGMIQGRLMGSMGPLLGKTVRR